MESYSIRQLNFSYPENEKKILKNINLTISQGEFVTLCGPSGCGKTTLLRQLKPVLSPHGIRTGEILFQGEKLEELEQRKQSAEIGFVLQSPDNQIVTDKVWHELAFGLESLGYDTPTIRLKVAEMASFFGIQTWFYKDVRELSGGQKQLLNLAAIMAMHPSVLILDEPTSQLDPIAASDFLATIGKINREIGTTIVMTEHRLEEVLPLSDRIVVLDQGSIVAEGDPKEVGKRLSEKKHKMFAAMPVPMQIYANVPNELECPVTVREGREWLNKFSENNPLKELKWTTSHNQINDKNESVILELNQVWFRYEKDLPDVVKGLNLHIKRGELFTLLGGNGTGKSTTLSLLAGLTRPYRGTVKIQGRLLSEIPEKEKFGGLLGILPQNPQALFVKKTVKEDLYEMVVSWKISNEAKNKRVDAVIELCQLDELLERHPYDLSGGEQQKLALAKVLLLRPEILLLDEPTKGLDAEFKQVFAEILRNLKSQGITIVMVSHDVEFFARYADRCAMFFDGNVVTEDQPRKFFSGNSFYTTEANRMARHLFPEAITADDIIQICGGEETEKTFSKSYPSDFFDNLYRDDENVQDNMAEKKVLGKRLHMFFQKKKEEALRIADKRQNICDQVAPGERNISKRTKAAAAMILLLIPLTIFFGIYYLDDRKYYFISMLIILETMLPFVMIFEDRKPQPRELIIVSVLCAIGVAGRCAFFMLPHFKPVAAVVILAGIAFGGETGFLVGALIAFVSNIFCGQGPWTPWQMFGFGVIGFVAGILFKKGLLRSNKLSLAIFGGLATFFIYGGILNPASVLMFYNKPTVEMFILAYMRGIPVDLVHASSTVFFLWIMAESMLEKLDRIKIKYGLIQD